MIGVDRIEGHAAVGRLPQARHRRVAEIDQLLARRARAVVFADQPPLLVVDEVGDLARSALAHPLPQAVDRVAIAVAGLRQPAASVVGERDAAVAREVARGVLSEVSDRCIVELQRQLPFSFLANHAEFPDHLVMRRHGGTISCRGVAIE